MPEWMDEVALSGMAAVEYATQCGLLLRYCPPAQYWLSKELVRIHPADAIDAAEATPDEIWLANRDCLWALAAWKAHPLAEAPCQWEWRIQLFVPRDFSRKLAFHVQLPRACEGNAGSGADAWWFLKEAATRLGLVRHEQLHNAVIARVPDDTD